jgi:hypothetical protein
MNYSNKYISNHSNMLLITCKKVINVIDEALPLPSLPTDHCLPIALGLCTHLPTLYNGAANIILVPRISNNRREDVPWELELFTLFTLAGGAFLCLTYFERLTTV